jgi:hypothetical protein
MIEKCIKKKLDLSLRLHAANGPRLRGEAQISGKLAAVGAFSFDRGVPGNQEKVMRDQDQGSQRSAIGGDHNFNFPVSQLDSVTRNLTNYILVDPTSGRIWTSAPDQRTVDQGLTEVKNKLASFAG